ncbi:hypothetical protein [Salinispora vitiensis]|uniref:hypothetical protein n=1 Tax=Salinispora vitiensis TaxID=999544 RepID=UPI00037E4EED|nr:hypothetical protein [Salinispora vitiensis]
MEYGEVARLLAEREAACRAEADRLEGEAERIAGLLSVCRKELERLTVAREVIGELPVADLGAPVAGGRVVGDGLPASAADVAGSADELVAVLIEFGRPVRCQEVVARLGEDPRVARHVERVRHRLKKLKQAGRVVEPRPGVFVPADAAGETVG